MESVRFGLVGLGTMGLQHARLIMEAVEEVQLCAVATRNEAGAGMLRALPGGDALRVFDTPRAMYESGCIDAVLIASPHRVHVAQAKEAFACGMHVLLEKPTGVFTREVRELNEAAAASARAFGVMFNQRTDPAYRRMREIVASGELGEIRRTSVVVTDWLRAQSYYDGGAWRATWKQDGGGVLLNQAQHNLDLWQWICGMPKSVHAFCGFGRWHDVEIEDDVTAYAEYENGATGTFIACTGEAPGVNRFEISMDGGRLVYEHGRLLLSRSCVPASRFIREYTGEIAYPDVTTEDITPAGDAAQHAGVIRSFARHLLYGEEMTAWGSEGLNALMLGNAMILSAWTGRTVALPMDEASDAAFEALLVGHASKSRERNVKPAAPDTGCKG